MIVKDDGTILTKDTDYTVTYEDNTNAGTAVIRVTYIGNYEGNADSTVNFTITKAAYPSAGATLQCEGLIATHFPLRRRREITALSGTRKIVKVN